MKEQQKQKIRLILSKGIGYLTLYALLPVLCGAVVAILFWVNSIGPKQAQDMFHAMGDQMVFAAIGAHTQEEKIPLGFYLLSPELKFPGSQNLLMMVGGTRYRSPITPAPESPQPEETAPSVSKYYDALPAGAKPIVRADLSSTSYAINTTNYTLDPERTRASAFPCRVESHGNEPLVLVFHTHATECYFEDDTNLSEFAPPGVESYFLENETSFRTQDAQKSVVQVGRVFADTLTNLGIPTLHCTVMHDQEDYNNAYVNSAETVKAMLKEYPSIQYVIDLHRDSVVRGDSYVKSYTELEGKSSAQVMLVVGTNQNGRHPNWEQNLVVATAWKDAMDAQFPTLSRSLYLRTARFNQEYSPGCVLLEVGSAANTLEEAENAARFAARAFSKMLSDRR